MTDSSLLASICRIRMRSNASITLKRCQRGKRKRKDTREKKESERRRRGKRETDFCYKESLAMMQRPSPRDLTHLER